MLTELAECGGGGAYVDRVTKLMLCEKRVRNYHMIKVLVRPGEVFINSALNHLSISIIYIQYQDTKTDHIAPAAYLHTG